jgi:hypothetical protein
MNDPLYKRMTGFLLSLGIEDMAHTGKTYLGHLLAVHRLMLEKGCEFDACRAGMFHSIYGTEEFQRYQLSLERRVEVRALIGERAERLAYLNCAMDRASFDGALERIEPPYPMRDRLNGAEVLLNRDDFDDLCRVHLFDWLEQVPRSRHGYGYRRSAYRQMAERLGPGPLAAYDSVFANESCAMGLDHVAQNGPFHPVRGFSDTSLWACVFRAGAMQSRRHAIQAPCNPPGPSDLGPRSFRE